MNELSTLEYVLKLTNRRNEKCVHTFYCCVKQSRNIIYCIVIVSICVTALFSFIYYISATNRGYANCYNIITNTSKGTICNVCNFDNIVYKSISKSNPYAKYKRVSSC